MDNTVAEKIIAAIDNLTRTIEQASLAVTSAIMLQEKSGHPETFGPTAELADQLLEAVQGLDSQAID